MDANFSYTVAEIQLLFDTFSLGTDCLISSTILLNVYVVTKDMALYGSIVSS